ncbi:MAG TPA: hypothetical protein VGQ35_15195 [Dongiaceae bacterium]|nr:hypothetical protein [Dongiaceae bacterium]
MSNLKFLALCVVALTLAACEFVDSAVGPSVSGRVGDAQPVAIVPLDATKLGQPSATPTGAHIAEFHSNLAQLQQAAVQQVQRARQLQADMDAGVAGYQIAAGTIGPNQQAASDESLGSWQHAQAQLRGVSATLDEMNGLSNEVAKNVAYAAFLLQSIRDTDAAPATGAEDRRQLGVLEEATEQTSTSLDQLLDALRQEVLRQSHFLGVEGAKLANIAPPSAGTPTNVAMSPQPAPGYPANTAAPAGAGLASGRPFVTIRFENPGVEYEQQLYEAVSTALARSPNVAFDLVAVAPQGGTPEESVSNAEAARASTEKVMRSLLDMGFPAERISVSQVTDPNIQTSEVQLYVR